jgi:hypothetical protein
MSCVPAVRYTVKGSKYPRIVPPPPPPPAVVPEKFTDFPPPPPPTINKSKSPALVTVSVESEVKVSIVYAMPPTVILLDVPPVATP